MEPQKLEKIAGWCKGTIKDKNLAGSYCFGISIDTRTLKKGDVFIAIKGKNFDGHKFADTALKKGAVAVIASDNVSFAKTIKVKDTQLALGKIASGYRKQLNAYVIGVTGSDGKTTAKEFLIKTLSAKYGTKGTTGNLNNHLGLPLSLLNIDGKTEFCVLEMGISGKNELTYLGKIAGPQAGIITNVASAHLGFFKNSRELAQAKSEIMDTLLGDKFCLLNYDNKFYKFLKAKGHSLTICGFGLKKGADIRGIINEEGHDYFTFSVEGMKETFRINFWNPSIIYPALVSVAFAKKFNISMQETANVFEGIPPLAGRGLIHKRKTFSVIDETYNANPNSVRASVCALARKRYGKKIAVLGDMAELGRFSSLFHRSIGLLIKRLDIDEVLTLGNQSRIISETAGGKGRHFEDMDKIIRYIDRIKRKDNVFLVKGSRIMQMENIVNHMIS